jgi:hypothetical protein
VELVVAWKELLMAAGFGWQDMHFSVLHGVGHGLMVVAMVYGEWWCVGTFSLVSFLRPDSGVGMSHSLCCVCSLHRLF